MLRTMLCAAAAVAGLSLPATAAEPWAGPPSPHALAAVRNSLFVPTAAPARPAAPTTPGTAAAAPALARTTVATPPVGVTRVGYASSLFIGTPSTAVRSDSPVAPRTGGYAPVAQPSQFSATYVSVQPPPATAAAPSPAPTPVAAPAQAATVVYVPVYTPVYTPLYYSRPAYCYPPTFYYPPAIYHWPRVVYARPYRGGAYCGPWYYPRHSYRPWGFSAAYVGSHVAVRVRF